MTNVLDSMARNAIPFAKLGDPKAVREGSERTVLMPNGQKVIMVSLNGEWVPISDGVLKYTAATLPASLPAGTSVVVDGVIVSKSSANGVLQNQDNMKIPSSGTVCLVGCSVTQMNQIGAGLYGNTRQCDFGWANWLAHYLGGFDIVQNTAVGGASSGPLPFDPLNNVITQLPIALGYNTDWIWMDFGILNDVQRSCTVDQSLAYVDKILNMVAGRNVVAINCTPLGSAHTFATAERMAYMSQVNAGIADRCKKYHNVILVDAFSAIVNPVTGYAKAGLLQTDDNIHYNQNTCRAIANAGKNAISGKVVIVDAKFPTSQLDAYNATSNPKRAQTNPKLIGSGGSILSGFTGPVPAGCAISKAGASFTGTSAVDAVNGGWTVTVTGCGAANDILFLTLVTAPDGWASAGDKLRGGFKLALSGAANLLSIKPQISVTADGVTKGISTCLEPDNTDGTHVQSSIDLSDMSITVRLPESVVPSGVITAVKMIVVAQFSSTSAAAVFKLTDAWLEKA